MDFVTLPDHLNCAFFGTNSPILFRAEAGDKRGGVRVDEYVDHPPFVTVYGDTAVAREHFGGLLKNLRPYIDSLYRDAGIRSDALHSLPSDWFQMDVRGYDYRACFYGTVGRIHAVLHGSPDKARLVPDLEDIYTRLDATYQRFYGLDDAG